MTPRANTLPGTHITEEDLYVRAVDPSAGHDAFDCGQGMDLPAVLLGEERCWYADGDETSANQEKRTLILNTYFWSTACHTLLPQWFEQGFSIYYPAAGKVLIKLADPRFIDTLRVPPLTASLHPASLLEPLPQKDLFAIAAQQGLRSDKIFNLDYCALNNPDQEDNIRYLNLNALALLSEEQCDQLLASLAHYQEIGIYLEAGITRYHITFLLDKLNKAFSIVGIFRKENMPEPYLLPEYLHSIMSKNAIRSLVLNDYPVSMFKVIDFEKYDFSKLTKLVTGKHIAVELLYPLLNKQPPLEILELRSAPLDGVVYPSSLTKLNLISTASEVKKIFTQDTPSTVTVTVLEMNFYLIDSIKNFFPIKNINIQFDKAIELPIALKLNNLTECYIETFGN
ncbi:MAG TPA: hypothetical protein VHZ76_07705, partial [Gammaproteobacteria bacterium]|nr:hypothetical protein [Gammaproteobacteria bacterium]